MERFITTLKGKIYNKKRQLMKLSLSLVIWISKLMITLILIIVLLAKKAIDADYSALPEEIERNPKAPKFIVCDWVRKMILANVTPKIGQ